VAAALCATYIGGSVNFAAVAAMVQLESGPLMACTMAADNIAMAVYLAAIALIPVAPSRPPVRASRTHATLAQPMRRGWPCRIPFSTTNPPL
jgi:uncharacterized membrane protein